MLTCLFVQDFLGLDSICGGEKVSHPGGRRASSTGELLSPACGKKRGSERPCCTCCLFNCL